MDLEGKTVWQIAAGDGNRSYHDLCLRWDVIVFGPGVQGAWPECVPQVADDRSPRMAGLIEKFCRDISDGDLVVLRVGTSEAYGVGEVVGDYEWLDDFGDIDGWDLQHVRRVRWLWKYDREPQRFDSYALKLGDSIQPLTSEPVRSWMADIEVSEEDAKRPLAELPATCIHAERLPQISMDEVAQELFDEGMGASAIDSLAGGMDDLRRVASWYDRADVNPSESETIAYLVVPLLRHLGWTPQRMAVEWNRIDVALFDAMPRADQNLSVAVEAKKRDSSCLSAKGQAEGYVSLAGRAGCQRLIVTDGIRYGLYVRGPDGHFPNTPAAYLNLNRMMKAYPILGCTGAAEALRLMAADWTAGSR